LRHRCHEGAILSPAVISSKSSSEIYIKVDAWKIVRCFWCGTPESPAWTTTHTGVYCSRECTQAGKADETLGNFLLALFIVPGIIGGFASVSGVTSIVAYLGILLVVTALFSPLLIKALMEYRRRRAVPRYSRNTVVPSNTALLKALPPSAPCPQCDTSIDLKEVGSDMAYRCDRCGATGTIKVLGLDAS